MADHQAQVPAKASATQIERQLSPLEWPEVPRGWYETSSRYVRRPSKRSLKHLVSSAGADLWRRRGLPGSVAHLAGPRDRRELWTEIVDDAA